MRTSLEWLLLLEKVLYRDVRGAYTPNITLRFVLVYAVLIKRRRKLLNEY